MHNATPLMQLYLYAAMYTYTCMFIYAYTYMCGFEFDVACNQSVIYATSTVLWQGVVLNSCLVTRSFGAGVQTHTHAFLYLKPGIDIILTQSLLHAELNIGDPIKYIDGV